LIWCLLEKVRTFYQENPDADFLPAAEGGAQVSQRQGFVQNGFGFRPTNTTTLN